MLKNKLKLPTIIVSAKVFRTCLVFTARRWTFHELVNMDENRACDNVRVVRDRPKIFYSNNSLGHCGHN